MKTAAKFVALGFAVLAASALPAACAEIRGSWSASTPRGNLGGTWTAQEVEGGATGTWALQDPTGRIVMQGAWSASKAPQSWEGAWRAAVTGRAGEYSGTWAGATTLSPQATLNQMLESALKAVVTGTWKMGGYSGAWSIRTAQ